MGLRTSIPNTLAQPGVCTSVTRPLAPYEGQLIYETDTNNTMIWDGSQWIFPHDGTFEAKGDLFVGLADSDGTILPVGANDSVLVADSTTGTGLAWQSDLSVNSLTVTTLAAADIAGAISGQIILNVANNSGSALTVGTPVYISGVDSVSGLPEVTLSEMPNPSTLPPVGLMFTTVADGATGHVVVFGLVNGVDTSSYTLNAQLYMDPSGGLTEIMPSGVTEPIISIGRVVKVDATTGSILVTAGVPQATAPNLINISGAITTALSVQADSITATLDVITPLVLASSEVNAPDLVATNSLTVNSIEIDPTGADLDEVLVFDGTKFSPANMPSGGGRSFAYFMGA